MASEKLSFGKIASTPTEKAWSQAYNAGGLFAVLSLTRKDEEDKHEPLATIGKQFFNNLQAEFFTLEEKNLEGIRAVLDSIVKDIPKQIELTCIVAYNTEQTLYLFVCGNGNVLIHRGVKKGSLLSQSDTQTREFQTASGYLKNGDKILLATESFLSSIPEETIDDSLSEDDIDEAVETLTPLIHKHEIGSASAVIFQWKDTQADEDKTISHTQIQKQPPAELPEKEDDYVQEKTVQKDESVDSLSHDGQNTLLEDKQESASPQKRSPLQLLSLKIKGVGLPSFFTSLSHRKKVILSVAGILIVVLSVSILFTVQNQQAKERRELFDDVYPRARENYEEAEGLISLNKALARDELEEANDLLKETEGKFPQGTEEYEKTEELKENIAKLLAKVGDSQTLEAKEISPDENLLLATLIPQNNIAAVEDETSVYYLTDAEIGSVRKASKQEQTLIENDGDWDRPQSLGKFGSNLYVLDQANGILKFIPSGTDYSVSNYLTEDTDLSDAVSMAIDASVYVLFENGEVKKFTRGTEDEFELAGIENALRSPTQIVTGEEMDHLYILDSGTARIVMVDKQGRFVREFQTAVLQKAKAISVSTNENTASILSEDKLYEISL